MKQVKKLISINFIIIFILSMINLNQISFASNQNTQNMQNQGVINVENIENGVNVTLYKIATMEFDGEANQPKDGYDWAEGVKEWIAENLPEYSDVKEFYKNVESNSKEATEFYDKITAEVKQGNLALPVYMQESASGEAKYPVTEENLNGNVKFSGVEMGTYIVVIENGYMVYNPSVVNVLPVFDSETNMWKLDEKNVVIKASKPNITKTVTDLNRVKDNYSTADNILYVIQSDIPKYLKESASKKYVIKDEADKSLLINENTIIIYGISKDSGNVASAINENTYTLDIQDDGEKKLYTINFDYEEIKDYEKIKITYVAKLAKDENLVIGEAGNNNYAYLEYSNNPYIASSTQKQSSEKVTVFTYRMEVKSVDKDNVDIGLAGSEFCIEDASGNKLHFIKGNDGEYYLSEQEENSVTNISVNESGILNIKGLDEGEYIIKQVKAPDGYFLSSKSYKVNIEDSNLDGNLNEECNLLFLNTKTFALPVTGGMGIIVLIGLGTTLICIGVMLIISINKKRKILKNK